MRKGGDGDIDRLQMMREIKRTKLTDKTGWKGHRCGERDGGSRG